MRRGLAVLCAGVLAGVAPADTPLPALMGTATGPDRMFEMPLADGAFEMPPYFADGRETGATVLTWIRFEAPVSKGAAGGSVIAVPGLMVFCSHSEVPARATREGGDTLPAFLDLASVPYGAGATWGASGVVPQDADVLPRNSGGDRFVVCVNCATDTAITLTVGGAELNIPATNDFVRNLEVVKGDTSVAVSAAAAGAHTSLALAVNPWVHFKNGPDFSSFDINGGSVDTGITNCWTLLCWRASLSGGQISETLDIMDRDGLAVRQSSSSAYPAATLVHDSRARIYLATLTGPKTTSGAWRKVQLYGYRQIPGHALTDAELWRVWELDLSEIRRRGLDTAIWAPGEGPQ